MEPARASLRVTAVVWLVALVPGGFLAFVIAVFAFSPTQCPDEGGSVLCRYPSTQSGGVVAVGALLLGAVVAAVVAAVAGTQARQVRMLVLSAGLATASVAFMAVAGASWT